MHHRHGLPQTAIATLFQTSPAAISHQIGDIRRLLAQTGNTIQPATEKLATLQALYRHAAAHGIPAPAKINTAR